MPPPGAIPGGGNPGAGHSGVDQRRQGLRLHRWQRAVRTFSRISARSPGIAGC